MKKQEERDTLRQFLCQLWFLLSKVSLLIESAEAQAYRDCADLTHQQPGQTRTVSVGLAALAASHFCSVTAEQRYHVHSDTRAL